MIFVTGPLFAGKKAYISQALGRSAQELAERAVWDVQDLAAEADNLEELARTLARREIVIATEVGGGVVPVQAEQRRAREAAPSMCGREAPPDGRRRGGRVAGSAGGSRPF